MKWFGRVLTLLALTIGLGVSWRHPEWLPDRQALARWLYSDDDEEGREEERAAPPAELIDDGWCDAPRPHRSGEECRRTLPIIALASKDLARRIGLETAEVAREPHARQLVGNAETAYDARRAAEITPRVAGVLHEVRADLGESVRRGDLLAIVDSAQVGGSKTQFLTARATLDLAQATYDRTVKLIQAKAAPAKTEMESLTALNQAKAGLREAEQKLANLGFDDAAIDRIARERDTKNFLPIVAPIDGVIHTWDATRGEAVEPTTQLFALADTSRMWLWIDVYEADVALVARDQPVVFAISGAEGLVFRGKVTWMGTEVNPITRTTRVRAELANPDGRLRANQFGRATIQLEPAHEAVVVPRSAVQSDGAADLVFIAQEDGRYRPQRVLARPTGTGAILEIAWGLKPGQRVVTTRSFLLKSELFKDRLGAADND